MSSKTDNKKGGCLGGGGRGKGRGGEREKSGSQREGKVGGGCLGGGGRGRGRGGEREGSGSQREGKVGGTINMDPKLTTSTEMRRWLVVGICLHNVLIPLIRDIIRKVMPRYYEKMVDSHNLTRQTFKKHVESFGGMKLNYESINDNHGIALRYPWSPEVALSKFDYRVKDPESLAKLFMEPRTAKFSEFDDAFEASCTLAVLAGVEEFTKSIREVAKSLNYVVRVPWAHPIFHVWTEKKYNDCFWIMELLVKRLFKSEVQKGILGKLELWKTQGLEICLGKPLNDVLYHSLRNEVEELREKLTKYEETTGVEARRIRRILDLFKGQVHKAFIKLQNDQSRLERSCQQMEKELKDNLSLQMQRFGERLSRFAEVVHRRIDGLDGKLEEIFKGIKKLEETIGTHRNIQESSLELGSIRQFVEEENRHFQPNMELASTAYSRELDQPSGLDELDAVRKRKPRAKKRKHKTKP